MSKHMLTHNENPPFLKSNGKDEPAAVTLSNHPNSVLVVACLFTAWPNHVETCTQQVVVAVECLALALRHNSYQLSNR